MKKLFLKFFLLYCILFISGYTYLQAHVIRYDAASSTLRITERDHYHHHGNSEKIHVSSTNFSIYNIDERAIKLRSTIEKDEEEKQISFKKITDIRNYFTSVFCIQKHRDSFQNIKKCFQYCKHFCYSTSQKRFIVFRVIRI